MERRDFIKNISVGTTASYLGMSPFKVSAYDNSELSYHTIEKIFVKEVEINFPRYVGKNAVKDNHGLGYRETVCELVTNQGARGWSVPLWKKSLADTRDYVLGKRVSDLFSPAEGLIDSMAAYWDIALYDLAGNILKKPVYELMGAKEANSTSCYSGMIYFDDLTTLFNKPAGVDIILNECQFDYDLGYRQFKLKIGRGHKWMTKKAGIKRDIEVTKLVADAFPDCDILADANDGYSIEEFEIYLKGIEGTKLFWVEEPFRETMEDYTKLRSILSNLGMETLIADGEYRPAHKLLRELFENKLVDVHLNDIQGLGYTGWRKMLSELEKMNAYGSPHTWGTQIKTNAVAHLAVAPGNVVTIEGVTNISPDVDLGDYKLENGKLTPSSSPGFGMKLLVKDY